jgi:hypothetical protein
MIELKKEQIKNLISQNIDEFKDFSVAEKFATAPNESEHLAYKDFSDSVRSDKKLYGFISKIIGGEFTLNNEEYSFSSPFELANFIDSNNIEISEGESTWINNILKIQESLKGACCSTKANLINESTHCYVDLINQCDEDWVFVKNIKKILSKQPSPELSVKLIFLNNSTHLKTV